MFLNCGDYIVHKLYSSELEKLCCTFFFFANWQILEHLLKKKSLVLGTLEGFVVVQSQRRVWLGDPMDCSLPGFSVHGVSQTRILEWVPFLSSGDLPNPGIKPTSPALADRFFTMSHHGSP